MAVDPTTASTAATAGSNARKTLSANYDTFLTLLTAQLQHQDPLAPMDSTQFTQQLVAYSQVEQQISTNDNLDSLISLTRSAAGMNAVGYLGKTAFTDGPSTSLAEGSASWRYALGSDAATVTLTVTDANGRTVYTADGEKTLGMHELTWDGKKNDGTAVADGTYKLSIKAVDADGKTVATGVAGIGVIKEVDMSGLEPVLTIGTRYVNLSSVLGLKD